MPSNVSKPTPGPPNEDPISKRMRAHQNRRLGTILGYLDYGNKQLYPIVNIEFKLGMVHCTAKAFGPCTWECAGDMSVIGTDGITLLKAHIPLEEKVKVRRGDDLTIYQALQLHDPP